MGDKLSKRSIIAGAVAGVLGGLFIVLWVSRELGTAIFTGLVIWAVVAFAYEGASMKDAEEREDMEDREGGR
jgi:uncharacterized membrane protein YfcA